MNKYQWLGSFFAWVAMGYLQYLYITLELIVEAIQTRWLISVTNKDRFVFF